MYNLSRGLITLFHYQDIDKIIDALCLQDKHLDHDDLEDQLCLLYRLSPQGYTIDQNKGCAKDFVQRHGENGVFGALADFVKACCTNRHSVLVCKFEELLRWNEVSASLTEDLLVCSYWASTGVQPPTYSWAPFLKTDSSDLNLILDKELADVHAHLIGSSLNFDVNWLCLMNHIDGREKDIADIQNNLQSRITSMQHSLKRRSFYSLAIIAAAIRVKLFGILKGVKTESEEGLAEAIKSYDGLESCDIRAKVSRDIQSFMVDSVTYYSRLKDKNAQYDYAHSKDLDIPRHEACAYSVLSGERYIIHGVLQKIYHDDLCNYDATLFYIYLLIKHKFRCEIVQSNEEIGLSNFMCYDDRKSIFARGNSMYGDLIKHLSVASFFANHEEHRWHETRIPPEASKKDLLKFIKRLESKINDEKLKRSDVIWRYGYIFHFVKELDVTDLACFELKVRHEDLRDKIKGQVEAIVDASKSEESDYLMYKKKILGIDAASSELLTRPEVFAQAYRYCKDNAPDLGITYHVGEDYHDLIDGIRSVDECMRFLDLKATDRLGHALALGIDPHTYYKKRNYQIIMPKQVAMDNFAWLYNNLGCSLCFHSVRTDLKSSFDDLASQLYSDSYGQVSINLYYQSWLLRGDNPKVYRIDGTITNKDDVDSKWSRVHLLDTAESNDARKCIEARKLFYLYHHDKTVKTVGAEMTTVHFNASLISAIAKVQSVMLKKLENKGLSIECNPTSNVKIADIDRYDEHPICKFHSRGLKWWCFGNSISSSINTDDKGVFATSIEREYALMAAALSQKHNNSEKWNKQVFEWLDVIRQDSLKQKFIK